jgi:membrane protease YdiL (CAAX protease family)
MLDTLAHITPTEVPSMWLAALVGFVAGVAVTYAFVARKLK